MPITSIFLNISEIASFVGQNKWDNITPFERVWKKYDNEYNICLYELNNEISKKKIDLVFVSDQERILQDNLKNKLITKREFTKSIKENQDKQLLINNDIKEIIERVDNISLTQTEKIEKDLGEIITKTISSDNHETSDKRKITNDAINNLVKTGQIKDVQKQELLKQTESLINKTHGTLTENAAIKMFEEQNNLTLDTTQIYHKYIVNKTDDYEWYIGGKMDGIYTDNNINYVVEVKNRMKGFFTSIREYELTQIQLYLLLIGYDNAKLVEKYNKKIRVTDVPRQQDYIDDTLEYLNIFIHAFIEFLSDFNMKMTYISSNDNEKNKFLDKLYIKQINKLRQKKAEVLLVNTQAQQDCLLDDLDDF